MAADFPVELGLASLPDQVSNSVLYAAAILVTLYILIIFELIHRTLAALLASTAAISVLAILNERPTLEEIVSWLDVETLILLFGMMTMVSIFCETGFFDYVAVVAYKLARGEVWPLLTTLCVFTAVISAFLDNVTTILLMTPVTIRLCEAVGLDAVPVLMALVVFSNIGGTATAVGDPPNVIIASNEKVISGGVDFATFTLHMSVGVAFVMLVAYGQLRLIYRKASSLRGHEPPEVTDLRHEMAVWQRAASTLSLYTRDEVAVRDVITDKVYAMRSKVRQRVSQIRQPEDSFNANLRDLQEKYQIRDWPLLTKSAVVLTAVIILFFLHSIPNLNLSLGWTALLGAVTLLALADIRDMETVLARVEWTTLLFFAALFVLMESLARLRLLDFIGSQTEAMIHAVDEDARLAVAIVVVLWVSALASAFIDNIPFTSMMVQIVTRLGSSPHLHLPLQPLVWALAFGACLGGNGTLIGASANVVCAGVCEQHGYRFTFLQFFKFGFPMMVVSVIVATVYLLVCHVVFNWNG